MNNDNIVSVDLGNGLLKAARILSNGTIMKSKLPNKIAHTSDMNSKNLRIYNDGNKVLYMGIGSLNNNILKHKREYLLEQSLVMICELFPGESNIVTNLRIGVPAEQFLNPKYVEELKSKFITKRWMQFNINGDSKSIFIQSVTVYAEGYSAMSALNVNTNRATDVLVVDLGCGTMDLASFSYDYEDQIYNYEKVHTINKGTSDISEQLAKEINVKNGTDFKPEKIDYQLSFKDSNLSWDNKIINIDDYTYSLDTMFNSIKNEITDNFGQLEQYFVLFAGGGTYTYDDILSNYIKPTIRTEAEERIYANCIGYLNQ